MAETMGVRGMTVRKPGEFAGALERAVETPGPVLISVLSDIDAVAPRGTAERSGLQ